MGRWKKNRPARAVIWGIVLIALGVAFLFQQTGTFGFSVAGKLWPIVMFAIAVSAGIEGRFGAMVMFLLLGSWFLAVNFGWMGLTFRNSWGLALVAVGLGNVVRALGREPSRWHEVDEVGHE